MGMLDWFRRRPMEQKASQAGGAISAVGLGSPAWSVRDYAAFADEGYTRNSIAFACVKMIARSAATVPWLLFDSNDKEINEHALLDLLFNPNPLTPGGTFFESAYSFLLISGNNYMERVETGKKPKELWNLRPDRMKVIVGKQGMPAGYEYTANGIVKTWAVNQITGEGPILHLKEFNPLDDWYGLSRMEAAAYGIDRHNAASVHNKALLDNGARPSGALIYEPLKVAPDTYKFAPEEAIQEAKNRLMEGNTGPANAGKPMVLGGAIKWENMGISPRDMDFNEGKDDSARDICAAFGVPHILLVPGNSTYNNVALAKLDLWEDTILPLVDRMVDGLNLWLAPKFGEGLRLGIDLDEISALEPRREVKRKSIVDLYDKGIIIHQEAREALQYEPKNNMVKNPDAGVINALAGAVSSAGIGPLASYLRAMGLIAENLTDEQVMEAASSFVERLGPKETSVEGGTAAQASVAEGANASIN